MTDVTKIWAKSWQAPKGHKEQGRQLSIDIVAAADESEKAEVRIIGYISSWWNGSEDFRNQIDWLWDQGYRWLHIYMHSGGGSTTEAAEIKNIIRSWKSKGGKVSGNGGALIASAATYIVAEIEGFTQVSNGLFMIHKPVGVFEGNVDQITSSLQLLSAVTEDYAKVYSARTGMTEEAVKALYEKGDFWMTAKEAADKKFISGVADEEELTMDDVNALKACNYPEVDKIAAQVKDTTQNKNSNTNSNNHTEMDIKVLAVSLGLDANATEAQVDAKLKEQKQATEELARLRLEKEQKDGEEIVARVKTMLDQAQNVDRKITAKQRPHLETLATKDFEGTKSYIESLEKVNPISAQLDEGNSNGIEASKKDWSYKDWAEKDMPGLKAMMKNQTDNFKALYKAEYGVEASIPESN